LGRPYISLFSTKKTGPSSSTALTSSPRRSWHSLAATTVRFGTPSRSFSSDWLCVGPYPRRPPIGVRTTSGTVTWSSYISRNFAIPLTI